jgi:hypothetical protein
LKSLIKIIVMICHKKACVSEQYNSTSTLYLPTFFSLYAAWLCLVILDSHGKNFLTQKSVSECLLRLSDAGHLLVEFLVEKHYAWEACLAQTYVERCGLHPGTLVDFQTPSKDFSYLFHSFVLINYSLLKILIAIKTKYKEY